MQLPVRAIAFSPSGGHALSASEGERQVALWALPAAAAAPSKKSRPSAGLLSLEEPALQLATSAASSSTEPNEASSFQVIAPRSKWALLTVIWIVLQRDGIILCLSYPGHDDDSCYTDTDI